MSETTAEQDTVSGTYAVDYQTGTTLDLDAHRDDVLARFAEKHPEADIEGAELQVVEDNIGRDAKVKVTAPTKAKKK